MRKTPFLLAIASAICLFSCKRDHIDLPRQQEPLLTHTITRDVNGNIRTIDHYNQSESIISDSSFDVNGKLLGYNSWEYNSRNKMTRWENHVFAFTTATYLWARDFVLQNDTTLVQSNIWLKGSLVERWKHFCNSSHQPVTDSLFLLGYTKTTNTIQYTYDAQGRPNQR